jgi:hypothetical protein
MTEKTKTEYEVAEIKKEIKAIKDSGYNLKPNPEARWCGNVKTTNIHWVMELYDKLETIHPECNYKRY